MVLEISTIISLPKNVKRVIVLTFDCISILISTAIAFYLRIGFIPEISWQSNEYNIVYAGLLSLFLAIPIFWIFGFYNQIFRYSYSDSLVSMQKGVITFGIAYFIIIMFVGLPNVPRTIGVIQPTVLMVLIILSRFFVSYFLRKTEKISIKKNQKRTSVLIYGAGINGRRLAASLKNSESLEVKGFLDDDKKLQSRRTSRLLIYSPDDISKVSKILQIDMIILAISKIDAHRENAIKLKFLSHNLPVKIWRSEKEFATDAGHTISVSEILNRETGPLNFQGIETDIKDRVVLITGAGGSIGGELSKQLILIKPKKIIILENNEYALYRVQQKLISMKFNLALEVEVVSILGSVTEKKWVEYYLKIHRPFIIYHTAAYKHVPLVEENFFEGFRNNVFGSLILSRAAIKFGVKKFVLISSDKAVRPTNIMGATKRLSEMGLQALASRHAQTSFAIVRFGNVLESSGSVVPLFREQIRMGGPVTVTHENVTRYFMTISEAVSLVLISGAMNKNKKKLASLYILDMGEPLSIYGLAKRLITFSGKSHYDPVTKKGEIEIAITGLRAGEKLHEELLIGKNIRASSHSKIFIAEEDFLSYRDYQKLMSDVKSAIDKYDKVSAIKLIHDSLPEFSNLKY